MRSHIQQILDSIRLPEGEPVEGKTYIADGWIYRDYPRTRPEDWDQFLEIIGSENYVALTLADYGTSKRGQLLISPQGVQNIRAAHASRKARTDRAEGGE